jgi:hypothetical protein
MVDPLIPTSRTPEPFGQFQPNLVWLFGMEDSWTQAYASYQGVSINDDIKEFAFIMKYP